MGSVKGSLFHWLFVLILYFISNLYKQMWSIFNVWNVFCKNISYSITEVWTKIVHIFIKRNSMHSRKEILRTDTCWPRRQENSILFPKDSSSNRSVCAWEISFVFTITRFLVITTSYHYVKWVGFSATKSSQRWNWRELKGNKLRKNQLT